MIHVLLNVISSSAFGDNTGQIKQAPETQINILINNCEEKNCEGFLNPRLVTLDPRLVTLDPRLVTLDPRLVTLDPRPSTKRQTPK